ncbi:hypothetical protein D3C80_1975080 [compost metagenome]
MPDCYLYSSHSSVTEPEYIRFLNIQIPQQCSNVISILLKGNFSIPVAGTTVRLKFDADQLAVLS